MKFELITKFGKRNIKTSEMFEDNVMSENYDVIVNFLIFDQFGAIQKPDSGRAVY